MGKTKYYLGLDMGTNSVGWAVTDENYQLLRAKGKDLWGIREFDEAEVAVNRRMKRTSRRNHQRKLFRIGMLKYYFADEIAKVDPNFYARLKNSKYYEEDKEKELQSKYGIFNDKDYTDKEYFEQYPTIFHLRSELIHNKEEHDVRLVFLALLNMFKHRGHFLNAGLSSDESTRDMKDIFTDFLFAVNESLGLVFENAHCAKEIEDILGNRDLNKSRKTEEICTLLQIEKSQKKQTEIIKAICGRKVKAEIIFEEPLEEDKKLDICFADFSYEEKIPEIEDALGEEYYRIIELMKEIYDKGILAGIMLGENYLSDARIKSYEKHKTDLQILKEVVKEYGTQEQYNDLFRRDVKGSYSAYVNSYNCGKERKEEKRRRGFSERSREDFYKYIKKLIGGFTAVPGDIRLQYISDEIEKETFLPKQMTASNGVIPNQAHQMEMKAILRNAENYLPFLLEKDESGLTVSERIIELYKFQIPYYIGPTSIDSVGKGKTGWVERKAGMERAKVYPWNFEEIIDTKKTSEKFIERMVRRCTYIEDETVLPKDSLMYERFKVLNEINNIRINDVRISVSLKQEIYETLFEKGKRVSRKQIFQFLQAKGLVEEDSQITGIDVAVNNSLSSFGKFKAVFGDRMKEDSYKKMAEDIIFWCTVYGDSKEFLKEQLMEHYPEVFADEKILKRIMGFKFKDWGNLSRKFLELEGCKLETGEQTSLLHELWESQYNLMELLHSEEYNFGESLKEFEKKALNSVREITAEDLDDFYFSAPVKRMVWQTILIIRELESVLGCAPERVFIEMTRKEEKEKKRTTSRKQQLLDLYKNVKDESQDWKQIIEDADSNGKLRSKKMYLYLTQMGRCMYSGERIELQDLFNDNLYDIDHVYPRHYVKDDNLNNNLVLVKKEINNHKSDNYPLEPEIRTARYGFWKELKEKDFITEEKYRRLTGRNEFSEEQKADFIARQLVETSQGTKGVADLLKQLMPETTLVYSKAGNVSDFRNKFKLYKSRLINDFHHANDAYLNIVVGNVYYVKFTQNPLNYIRNEYKKDKDKYDYHLARMFDFNVERNGEVAWVADPGKYKDEGNEKGSIVTVKKTMAKHTPLMTRYSFVEHGKFYDENAIHHNKTNCNNYVPLKTSDIRNEIKKYGGYTSLNPSYFIFVEYDNGKKRKKAFETVYSLYAESIQSEKDLYKYCESILNLKNPKIICPMIKKKTLIKINGYFAYIVGMDARKNVEWHNAVNMRLSNKYNFYFNKLEKSVNNKELCDEITSEKNIEIYQLLCDKHNSGIWNNKIKTEGNWLLNGKIKFESLDILEQCIVLVKILKITNIGVANENLSIIGGGSECGRMRVSGNMTDVKELKLIHQSVTGLFEQEVDLLKI